jgi:hypothetical protein
MTLISKGKEQRRLALGESEFISEGAMRKTMVFLIRR